MESEQVAYEQNTNLIPSNEEVISSDKVLEVYSRYKNDLFRNIEDIEKNYFPKAIDVSETISELSKNLYLQRIDAIRYRDREDISKAIQYFYRSCHKLRCISGLDRNKPINVIYILEKRNGEVSLYLGCVLDKTDNKEQLKDAFKNILPGLLPGCTYSFYQPKDKDNSINEILNSYKDYEHRHIIYGIPGDIKKTNKQNNQESQSQNKKDEDFSTWGIERVLDAVDGDFSIIGYSKPIISDDILTTRAIFNTAIDFFHQVSKLTVQESENFSETNGINESATEGKSTTYHLVDSPAVAFKRMLKRWCNNSPKDTPLDKETRPELKKFIEKAEEFIEARKEDIPEEFKEIFGTLIKQIQKTDLVKFVKEQIPAEIKGPLQGKYKGETSQRDIVENESKTVGTSHQKTKGHSSSVSIERINSLAQATEQMLKLYDKRFEKGIANGMWQHTTQVVSSDAQIAKRVTEILSSFWAGDSEQPISQINSICIPDELTTEVKKIPLFELGKYDKNTLFEGNPFGKFFTGFSTLLTHEEMAIVAGAPKHEVPGIFVEKLTDFARNYPKPIDDSSKFVNIGKLLDRETITNRDIAIDFNQLQRHVFVTGATGAGKSTTMRKFLKNLNSKNIPFLVIEPVKQEYRELKNAIPNLRVITLGSSSCDYSLNPFEIEEEVGLIPHIDNLKAAFNASMGNYSSMPFILEDILYKAYEQCGWDLGLGKNIIKEKVVDKAGFSAKILPTMSDMLPLVSESIKSFFEDRSSDYGNSLFGALKARISSMTRGAKGKVLNSIVNSISMEELLKTPCVIELSYFTDNEEKAFVMALLMIKLYEYRQAQSLKENNTSKPLEHILVIEEAHRLLAKQQNSGEHSSNGKQKAVEFFADMLAEIRSYGQGIVIVDQIPSKLISDVVKNTDVKIAHRLADKEDRDIIGNTMNLNEEQMKDITRLSPGEAIVYYGGLRQALKIKVEK